MNIYKKLFSSGTFKRVVAKTTMFDVAIGLALAGVFVKVVNAFVTYILTPPIGALIGGKSLANFNFEITFFPGKEPVLIRYGMFLDSCIEFVLVLMVVYWTARVVLGVKRQGAGTKNCADCAMEVPKRAQICPYCAHRFR
ncbi:MAG: MscL family protein [Chlamydiales bacterium]|nr:MscL family protein [Chlamydiales bacterium]